MGGSVRSAPVLRSGVLYVTSMAGNLHAIDVEQGRQKWQFQAAAPIHSTPSLSGNKVLLAVTRAGLCRGLRFGKAGCGKPPPPLKSGPPPCIRHGVAFFGSADAHVYAVEVDTGRKRWTRRLGGRIYSTAWVGDEHLYLGCGDGKVYCLATSSGKTVWSTATGNGIDSSPAVAETPC
jgi:outer membrane protein assembly factor BamB